MALALDSVASPVACKYLALKSARGIGPILARRLIQHFGGIDGVFQASVGELARVERVSPARARQVQAARDEDTIAGELALAAERGVRIICEQDCDYPAALKYLPDPPVCLYVSGTVRPEDMLALAIVGTRRCTRYGGEQARRFGVLLAQAGFTVVSGLARGVDGLAHHGALEAGGRSLAVLGNGLTDVYPPEHTALAERIRQSGAVLSELPMTAPPDSGNFEPRNRIIAGLCLGVLVIEAARKSGALLTARLATEYNREVFAVPGRIDTPEAAGTNTLIRNGEAKLVMGLEDILEELGEVGRLMPFSGVPVSGDAPGTEPSVAQLDPDQQRLWDALGAEETGVEALADETELPIPKVVSTLMALQLRGLVRELPGQRFVCVRRPGSD
ncbi:MAG: DNA-processing protein DprA [Planctomycetota bacterium]